MSHIMTKKVTVTRNESRTYAVHLELGNPPKRVAGGLSLDLARLKVELEQYGCSDDTVAKALADLEDCGLVVLMNCDEAGAAEASAG